MGKCELCQRKFGLINYKFKTKETNICGGCLHLLTGSLFKAEHEKIKNWSKNELQRAFSGQLEERGVETELSEKNNKECPICTKQIKKITPTYKTLEGYKVCSDHYNLFGHGLTEVLIVPYSLKQIKLKVLNEIKRKEVTDEFSPTINFNNAIFIEESTSRFGLSDYSKTGELYNLNDIKSFEIVENNNVVSSGGLGQSIIGGVAFGGVGAIVGAITGKKNNMIVERLVIKINLKNLECPVLYINLIEKPINSNDDIYIKYAMIADEIVSGLDTIIKPTEDESPSAKSNIEKLREYKLMLDEGLITDDEFSDFKKKFLGI